MDVAKSKKQLKTKRAMAHMANFQIAGMLAWAAEPQNLLVLQSESNKGKKMEHGGEQTKKAAFGRLGEFVYKVMMAEMHKRGRIDPRYTEMWDDTTARSRWSSYSKRYKNLHYKLHNQTGSGVPKPLQAKGVTLEQYVEMVCPMYHEVDRLFWEQPNVKPIQAADKPSFSDDEPSAVSDDGEGVEHPEDEDLELYERDSMDVEPSQPDVSVFALKRGYMTAPSVPQRQYSFQEDLASVLVDLTADDTVPLAIPQETALGDVPVANKAETLLERSRVVLGEPSESSDEQPNDAAAALTKSRSQTQPNNQPSKQGAKGKCTRKRAAADGTTETETEKEKAERLGLEKAQNAKRKDFGSVFVETSQLRLEFEERKFGIEMANSIKRLNLDERLHEQEEQWRHQQHEAEIKYREQEFELRAKQLQAQAAQKREEERGKMAVQLLMTGMPLEVVKATVAAFFSD